MPCGPQQLMILPDPAICQAVSATSEAGPCTPTVVEGADNCGNLAPFVSGIPVDPALLPMEISAVQSGDANQAGWTFDNAGADVTVGSDELVFREYGNSFFGAVRVQSGRHMCYLSSTKQLLQAGAHITNGTIQVKRREVLDVDTDDWVIVATFDPTTIGAPPISTAGVGTLKPVSMETTESGVVLMAYAYVIDEALSDYGIAMLKSEDAGVTWELLHDRLEGAPIRHQAGIHLVRSGGWLKLVWMDQAFPFELRHRASRDGGLSWTDIELETKTFTSVNASPNNRPIGLISVGNGLFMLAYFVSTTAWSYMVATGESAFREISLGTGAGFANRSTLPTSTTPYGIGGAAAWGRVWVFITTGDGAGSNVGDQISAYFQDVGRVLERGPGEITAADSEWQPVESPMRMRGTRHTPYNLSVVNAAGAYLIIGGGLYDVQAGNQENAAMHAHFAPLSPRPLGSEPLATARGYQATVPIGANQRDDIYAVTWAAYSQRPAGPPNGAVSADTDWTQTIAGGGGVAYNEQRLITGTAGAGSTAYYELIDAAFAIGSWCVNGSVIGGVSLVQSGVATTLAEGNGVRIQSRTSGAANISIVLRIGPNGITLRNEVLGAPLVTFTIDTSRKFHWQIYLYDNPDTGNIETSLQAWNTDDPAGTYVESAVFNLTTFAGGLTDEIRFGLLSSTAANIANWYEIYVIEDVNFALRARGQTSDADFPGYLGIPANDLVCIGNGLSVGWGGGAAAIGDSYSLEPCYTYGVESVLQDGNLIHWRSDGLGAQEVILKATGDYTPPVSLVDHVYVSGLEEPTVEAYLASDEAFTIGLLGPFTLDTTYFAGLEVASQTFNTLDIVQTAGRRLPIDGELAGMRILMTSGANAGEIYCIDEHCGPEIRIRGEGANFETIGPGDTFDVFLTHGWVDLGGPVRNREYLRISMPARAATCTGDHRLGVVMFGCAVPVPIPFQWTHAEAEQPDVTLFEGPGVSWGYQRGPARRVWTGRLLNDYVRWRETTRYLLRSFSRYGTRPIVWIPDDTNQNSAIYGRFDGATDFQSSFWWEQDDGDGEYMFPGGDLQIRIVEVP